MCLLVCNTLSDHMIAVIFTADCHHNANVHNYIFIISHTGGNRVRRKQGEGGGLFQGVVPMLTQVQMVKH